MVLGVPRSGLAVWFAGSVRRALSQAIHATRNRASLVDDSCLTVIAVRAGWSQSTVTINADQHRTLGGSVIRRVPVGNLEALQEDEQRMPLTRREMRPHRSAAGTKLGGP